MAHKKKAHSKESKSMAHAHEAAAGRKENKSPKHHKTEAKAMKAKMASCKGK